MPPEPPPWDRKDIGVPDRKHERRASLDGIGQSTSSSFSTPRWREAYHTPHIARDFHSSFPRQPPTGHYNKQGEGLGQRFPDEPGSRCCTPSRSEDDGLGGCSGRHGSAVGGRSGSGRKSHCYFPRSPLNSTDLANQLPHLATSCAQRSVAEQLTSASSQILPLKDHHEKIAGGVDDGLVTVQRYDGERDHSLGPISWKPLKWSRSGSFSSSNKITRDGIDECGLTSSVHVDTETLMLSLTASPRAFDGGGTKKKQRLGWGQGLAKYEKQKVDGSEDGSEKNRPAQSDDSARANHSEISPRLACLTGSTSPATPSSVTSCSLQGFKDKLGFSVSSDATCVIHESPDRASHKLDHTTCKNTNDFSINLEHVGPHSISYMANCINLFLSDFPQAEIACTDLNFTRQTTMNLLLPLKGEILKVLERTEGEIDSFENELKCLNDQFGKSFARQGLLQKQNDVLSKFPEMSDNHEGESNTFCSSENYDSLCFTSCSLLDDDVHKDSKANTQQHGADGAKFVHGEMMMSPMTEKLHLCDNNKSLKVVDSEAVQSDSQISKVTVDDENLENCYCCKGGFHGRNSPAIRSNCEKDCNLIRQVLFSNKQSAKEAVEVFGPVLPVNSAEAIIWHPNNTSNSYIKKKLAVHKHFLKFKQRVLTFKYRAFYHLWKEDLRLISVKKHRSKSQKHVELSFRALQSGSQLLRSSMLSRFCHSGGNLTIFPTTEMIDFARKLLLDSHTKIYRNFLKMPPQILDDRERRDSRFITFNGLIEDPVSTEKEMTMVNPWTEWEKEEFLEKLALYGKDFRKISSFLDHKTTADCISFYYKNHKSESFAAVRKVLARRKYSDSVAMKSYLLAPGKWKCGVNPDSLDMLGKVSVMAASPNDNRRVQPRLYLNTVLTECHDLKTPHTFYDCSSLDDIHSEAAAADVLACISTALSSEGMNSCITSSFDLRDKLDLMQDERPLFVEVNETIDEEDTSSDEGYNEVESADWTDQERFIFIKALSSCGRDFGRISHCVVTKSKEQCKIFFSKARKCLGLDRLYQQGPVTDEKTPSADVIEGRSDPDDPSVLDMDSAFCNTQSSIEMDDVSLTSTANISGEDLEQTAIFFPEIDLEIQKEEMKKPDAQENIEIPKAGFVDDEKLTRRIDESFQSEANADVVPTIAVQIKESGVPVSANHPTFIGMQSQGNNATVSVVATVVVKNDRQLSYLELEAGDNVEDKITKSQKESQLVSWVETDDSVADEIIEIKQETRQVSGAEFDDYAGDKMIKIKPESHQISNVETEITQGQQLQVSTSIKSVSDGHQHASISNAYSDSCSGNKAILCSNIDSSVTSQNLVLLSMTSGPKRSSQVISWNHDDTSANSSVSTLSTSVSSIRFDYQHMTPPTMLSFKEHHIKPHHNSLTRDIYQQYCRQSGSWVNQPRHILRGYPLPILCKKEMIVDMVGTCGRRSASLQNIPKKNASSQFDEVHGDSYIKRPYGSRDGDLGATHLYKSDALLMPCSRGNDSEPDEQLVRTGDIKLFGRSLTQSPSLLKRSSSHEAESKQPSSKKYQCERPSNEVLNRALHSSGANIGFNVASEGLPLRSYGFWDGYRIRTGFASLPEPTVVLSNRFGGLTAGVGVYTNKDEADGNAVLKYRQALPLIGSKQYDQNSSEVAPGHLQLPGRTISVSGLGRSNILEVGSCTGVSDPVAAMRMHYAGHSGLLGSEEDSWTGDIGGR